MIGICFSNSFPSMAYPGATEAVIGNAPFGYAVPSSLGFPLVYDAAMTTSGGKLLQWTREGAAIPQGFAGLDAEGQPTLDPRAVLEGGTSLPIGLHKGAGLALLVEILTGVLGNGGFLHGSGAEVDPAWRMEAHSQCCIAVDAGHFMAPDELRDRVAAYGRDVKRYPAAAGEEILLPGERAHRTLVECREKGVPLEAEVAAELRACATRLGVTAPL
jgi:LDH2 family malate/lactate/ureidoglycolate dehydrogenase